jgi:hypothetical protein
MDLMTSIFDKISLFIYLIIYIFVVSRDKPVCITVECGGRAIAQSVSHRIPTAGARVQTRVWSCGIL